MKTTRLRLLARAVSTIGDVDVASSRAFCQEHRRCGDLDGGVEGDCVWDDCSCGAVLVRVVAFG